MPQSMKPHRPTPGDVYKRLPSGKLVVVSALNGLRVRYIEMTGPETGTRRSAGVSYFHASDTTANGHPRRSGYALMDSPSPQDKQRAQELLKGES